MYALKELVGCLFYSVNEPALTTSYQLRESFVSLAFTLGVLSRCFCLLMICFIELEIDAVYIALSMML